VRWNFCDLGRSFVTDLPETQLKVGFFCPVRKSHRLFQGGDACTSRVDMTRKWQQEAAFV
jgi:hypothetical protein